MKEGGEDAREVNNLPQEQQEHCKVKSELQPEERQQQRVGYRYSLGASLACS